MWLRARILVQEVEKRKPLLVEFEHLPPLLQTENHLPRKQGTAMIKDRQAKEENIKVDATPNQLHAINLYSNQK